MFNPLDFIERKRDGGRHPDTEIKAFVHAVMSGEIRDYQLSAWLMAVCFQGLDDGEMTALTDALGHSGDVIEYPGGMSIVDKHSTGGVGDKATLVLVPLVASLGARVSKLSGPGLGFTGGTVDKLESIPGMRMHLSAKEFYDQIGRIGCAISGHSLQLAPAEGKLYSMRDVTGTVPSLSLITTSILSKKLAGGAQGYVFDVKCGAGALMKNFDQAKALAEKLVEISKKLGKSAAAVITDMEQPLGEWVGNAAEVLEAVETLSGGGPADVRELCCVLGGEMLAMAGVAESPEAGRAMSQKALADGSALKKFEELVREQGGDAAVCSEPLKVLGLAGSTYEIKSGRSGVLSRLSARLAGEGLRALGGGRVKQGDTIDSGVAVRICAKIGDKINKGGVIMRVLYNNDAQLEAALPYLDQSWEVADSAGKRGLVLGLVK